VPILVFLGLSVLDLGPMYANATDKQASDRQTSDAHHRLMPPALGQGHNKVYEQDKKAHLQHLPLRIHRKHKTANIDSLRK